MKTERRHELQTNQLADTLAHWIDAAKPYSRAGLALLVAVVVGLFAWGYLSAQNTRREALGWTEYFDALNSRDARDQLSDIAANYASLPVGQWASLVLADIQLSNGTERLFSEKVDARSELKQAADRYRSVMLESSEPTILQRATFGLARAHEALGTLDEARREYGSIAEQWPDSPFADAAKQRAKDLEQSNTKSFYDWFAKYEPPRPVSKEPGIPGVRPDFLKEPLDGNSVKLPSTTDSTSTGPLLGTESSSERSNAESPSGEASPDAATPAEPPAASSEPAPDSK